jgi:hypothetical protein
MLEEFTYGGVRLNFATEAMRPFSNLFSFDSLNLLIGKNGAGKTHLLIQAAEVLSQGALYGDRGNYQYIDQNGERRGRDCKNPAEDFGFIYFTSLPYRRRLHVNPRLVDASRSPRTAMPKGALHVLRNLASALNEQPRLVGRVSYSEAIFGDVIARYVLDVKCELLNPQLQKLRIMAEDELDNSRRLNREGPRKEGGAVFDDFVRALKVEICVALDRLSGLHRIATLAALEKRLQTPNIREALLSYFLSIVGIISDRPPHQEHHTAFLKTRDLTLHYLLNEDGVRLIQDSVLENQIDFVVVDDDIYRQLQNELTAITVVWE